KFAKSYAGSMKPADALVAATALEDEAKDLLARTDDVKTLFADTKKALEEIENTLASKSKGKDATIGKLLARFVENGIANLGVTSAPAEMRRVTALQDEIATAIAAIKELKIEGAGVQGQFRSRMEQARKNLDT